MTVRWFSETDDDNSTWYAEHFRELAAEGADLAGEARLVDAVTPPSSRILDAGCGQGRTAAALTERGHHLVAVDIDATLLDAAEADNPGPQYVQADLSELDLGLNLPNFQPFQAAVSAGNVLSFVAPGTEVTVMARIRRHLAADAPYLVGFHIDRYPIDRFDQDLVQAGFILQSRFATWDLRPWHDEADFAVSILRNPQ